jgi:hypothetical protein
VSVAGAGAAPFAVGAAGFFAAAPLAAGTAAAAAAALAAAAAAASAAAAAAATAAAAAAASASSCCLTATGMLKGVPSVPITTSTTARLPVLSFHPAAAVAPFAVA